MFLLAKPGATSFVLKHGEKKVRVQLGTMHSCSCTTEPYCVHIAFVLLRVLRLQATNQLAFQTGLTDPEIEKVLAGPAVANAGQKPRRTSVSRDGKHGKQATQRNELTSEMYCPICLDGFDLNPD